MPTKRRKVGSFRCGMPAISSLETPPSDFLDSFSRLDFSHLGMGRVGYARRLAVRRATRSRYPRPAPLLASKLAPGSEMGHSLRLLARFREHTVSSARVLPPFVRRGGDCALRRSRSFCGLVCASDPQSDPHKSQAHSWTPWPMRFAVHLNG